MAKWQTFLAKHNEAWTAQRGWGVHWLQATVLLEPPEVIRTSYHRLAHHETLAPPITPTRLTAVALGERLRQRRLELGWSQIQAAEHFAVHQATWSRLERGQGRGTPALFKRLLAWCSPTPLLPQATPSAGDAGALHSAPDAGA
jgi:helix-turn-helix protein